MYVTSNPGQSAALDVANRKFWNRFVDTEKWRADTHLDEIVPVWDYPEKVEIAKYYKQFYHKTDKVNRQKKITP